MTWIDFVLLQCNPSRITLRIIPSLLVSSSCPFWLLWSLDWYFSSAQSSGQTVLCAGLAEAMNACRTNTLFTNLWSERITHHWAPQLMASEITGQGHFIPSPPAWMVPLLCIPWSMGQKNHWQPWINTTALQQLPASLNEPETAHSSTTAVPLQHLGTTGC